MASAIRDELAGGTLGAALRRAARLWPDQPALIGEARQLCWAELDAEVDRLAALLHELGVRAGDAVGFLTHKRPEVVTGFLAAARLGAIMAPINFKLTADRVRDQLQTGRITAWFAEPAFAPLMAELGADAPTPARTVAVGGALPGARAYEELAGCAPIALDEPGPDDPCYYNYTSGTTGRPKGAITTHRNIVANALTTIEGLGFESRDVFLGMFSVFSHPHELFHRSLLVGGAFVVFDTFSPRVVMDAVARWGITWMMAVPSFYEMMLDHADQLAALGHSPPDLSSLRCLEAGGAYVGAETVARMEQRFGARFVPVWGSTEATGVAIANLPEDRADGATGRPLQGYEVRVVDEAGAPVAQGEVGELLLRGPAIAHGYVGNPEETAALFQDGWYHTRDLVRQDERGHVHFAGRQSEMLKIGGLRVYPLEIEIALRAHDEIKDAVVVRAEDRLRGEMARAIVLLEPGSRLDANGVRRWCRAQLGQYKVPRFVEFWAELPRLPNGKVDRKGIAAVAPDPSRDDRRGA